MDVHIHAAVTQQLRRRGVDVLTAQDDGSAALSDEDLLLRSTAVTRVLFTHDIRFKVLAEDWQRQGKRFGGLVWGHPMRLTIGQMVVDLEVIAKATEAADWENVVEQLPL
jgi:hypothetical protein